MPFARCASILFIRASGCSKLWKSVDVTFNYGLDEHMKTKPYIALCLFTFIWSVSAADSKIEQAVRDQDAQWSKAAESRSVEKLLSFYADDAVVLPAHAAIATTKDSIQNIFQKLLSIPGVGKLEGRSRYLGIPTSHCRRLPIKNSGMPGRCVARCVTSLLIVLPS
ncbi:MAG: hypothetical protein DMF44_05785 [Verrucomicrobia bacterium]|nr:MAG: hypothetical protein DMF44_05785 [Verrucomicrobiota bacterium]